MNAPHHEMILASAGSGKTFALTDRFVQLLALGARPEQIVALTFTRKAAGEFFDGILNKLARAASDASFARELAQRIGAPAHEPVIYLRLLREVVNAMPRLSLSTLDAFFARIVRAFPLELGLAGDFEILQEHAALVERRRVLQRIFRRSGREPDRDQRNFIEAFKRATFGLEEKRLAGLLDSFLDQHHEVFLAAPDGELWGNPARIWPDGCSWLRDDPGAPTGTLRAWAEAAPIAEKQRQRWIGFLDALEAWLPGATPPREMVYILEKALAAWDALARGDAVLEFDRKRQELSAPACAALKSIVLHIVGGELRRRLETTRGIHAVLDGYEQVYQDAVRRAGRLTFADVQRLLRGQALYFVVLQTGPQSTKPDPFLLIDWRLDGRFDHWLLDEFQDTSHGQWSVLRNLVDEVVQDDSGRRTLFYVGDVKQAIYAWREGDSRLFREIFNHYNAARPDVIAERRLDRSFRSGPAILAMVNRVFGQAAVLRSLYPAPAAERWSCEWRDHESAVPERAGQAAWLFAEDERERFEVTLRLLQEIRPLERGLTVGVLTQRNDTAARLADHLRRAGGLPAIAESDLHVCTDNPLTAALLALLQAAAHPGDTLALEHVRMTPLLQAARGHAAAEVTRPEPGAPRPDCLLTSAATTEGPPATHPSPDNLTRDVLRAVHAQGFEATIEHWLRRLEPHLADDDVFSRERGRQMVEAARLFDENDSREVEEFIQFMERHVVREADTSAVVRVMTIHKSKGLGFDLVIVPDLEGDKLATRREGLAVQKNAARDVEWVLDLPPKLFHTHDPVLAAHVADAEADACYDKLALLYVALTRAKRGLHVVTKNPAHSSSLNFTRLLGETLGTTSRDVAVGHTTFDGAWTSGDPCWHEAIRRESLPAAPAPITSDPRMARHRAPRLIARTPSDGRSGTVNGTSLFAGERDTAAIGTEVHVILAAVEWLDGETMRLVEALAHQTGASPEALAIARGCLHAPECAAVFQRPNDSGVFAEAWRERAFELATTDSWITGKFDRVVVERRQDGNVRRVRIYDFKTDRTGTSPEAWQETAGRHASQLRLYRQAAATLAGVAPERVSSAIVLVNAFTPDGRHAPPIEVR